MLHVKMFARYYTVNCWRNLIAWRERERGRWEGGGGGGGGRGWVREGEAGGRYPVLDYVHIMYLFSR